MSKKKALIILVTKYALIGSILFVLMNFSLIWMDKNPLLLNAKIPFGLMILPIIYFAMNLECKNYIYGGKVLFTRLLSLNLLLLIAILMISSLFIYITIHYHPQLFENYKSVTAEVITTVTHAQIEKIGENANDLEQKKNIVRQLDSVDFIASEAIKNTIFGVIMSVILSIIISYRRQIIISK